MFGENNFQLLLDQMNLQITKENIKRNTNKQTVSFKELRQTVGILLYMSVVQMPNMKLYWRSDMRINAVSSVMIRDRFFFSIRHMRLSDNDKQPGKNDPGYDKLYKIREFITNISQNFAKHADTEEILSIDEQIIPFKGKLQGCINAKYYGPGLGMGLAIREIFLKER